MAIGICAVHYSAPSINTKNRNKHPDTPTQNCCTRGFAIEPKEIGHLVHLNNEITNCGNKSSIGHRSCEIVMKD